MLIFLSSFAPIFYFIPFQAIYAASTKSEKTNMSTSIVTQLLNSDPPRRFLEKSDETGQWQEVPLKRAATKTSQALRDVARDRAKASSNYNNGTKSGGTATAANNNISAKNKNNNNRNTSAAAAPVPNSNISSTRLLQDSFALAVGNNNHHQNGFVVDGLHQNGVVTDGLPPPLPPPPQQFGGVENNMIFVGHGFGLGPTTTGGGGGPQTEGGGEQFNSSSVDVFLEELSSGVLDDISNSSGDGVGVDLMDDGLVGVGLDDADNISPGVVGSSAIAGVGVANGGGIIQQQQQPQQLLSSELALLEWINSSKIQLSAYSSSSHGGGGGGMSKYLESALGIAIKLTEFIIKSDEIRNESTSGGGGINCPIPLECISVENTVVCINTYVSMALGVTPSQEDDITVVIKNKLKSGGGGEGGSGPGGISERLFAVGKILVPLLSGAVEEIIDEVDGSAKTSSPTMDSINLSGDGDECSNNSTSPPKKRQQVKPYLPVRLERLDLPPPVTAILSNLLECGQGEFVSNEAYTSFGDLLVDLKLLKMEGLSRFLQSPNLEISDKICGREMEIELINASFRNRTGSQGVFLTGAGGVGKSRIAAHIFELTRLEGGLVFATKFDQNKDASPLAKIGVIINELIDLFATAAAPSTLLSLSNDLDKALGIHAALLYEVMPTLSRIMPSCSQVRYPIDQVNVANSMKFLFCKLFEILISYQTGRVTVLFDDLQWADSASLNLISSMLQCNEGAKQVYFVSCYRDDEVNNSLGPWLDSISGLSLDRIKLESLTPDGVNQFVSETLHLFPRLTSPLSLALHKKTGGNPLFLGQILSAIGGSGRATPRTSTPFTNGDEIFFSLSRRRWTWDIDKVEDLELTDDVVSFVVNEMRKISADLLFGLKVAACIGSRMTSDVIDILSAELDTGLLDTLHQLAQKGFLSEHVCSRKAGCNTPSSNLRFEFVHDKIQEAAYKFMSSQEQRLNHMRFGLALYPRIMDKSKDELLFMAINQINMAGPDSVFDGDQKPIIAGLNLNAGKRAGERSDFQSAFSLFRHGISYLEADCWEKHYSTSIELFDSAANAAVVVNDLEAVALYSDVVNAQAKCFEDKLIVVGVKLKVLIHQQRFEEAMETFSEILKDFGEPALRPIDEIQGDLIAMNSFMKDLGDDTLLSLSAMTQKKTIALVKVYCDISQILVFVDPRLVPAITLRNMLLTVQEGLCSKSPLVFAQYAQTLCSSGNSDDISESVRFGRLSKALREKIGSYDCGAVYSVVFYVMWLAQPFQALTEEFKLGKKSAEQSGDVYYDVGNNCLTCAMGYVTGEPLADVRRRSIRCIGQMKDHNMIAFLGVQTMFHSQLAALMDGPQIADAETVDDVVFDEKKALAAGKDNYDILLSYENNHLVRAFLFRKFDILSSSGFFETIPDPTIPNEPYRAMAFFFAGLVAFHFARQSKEGEQKWMKIGDHLLEKMECWNTHIEWNFQNKMLLMKAEKKYCMGETESAASLYEESIKSAHDHKFIHEEGVAHELFGHFHLERGHRSEALRSFNSSVECYMNWGALAVARRLEDFVQSTFGSESV